jgi:hypothetical protein
MLIYKLSYLILNVIFIGDISTSLLTSSRDNQHLHNQIEVRNFILIMKMFFLTSSVQKNVILCNFSSPVLDHLILGPIHLHLNLQP